MGSGHPRTTVTTLVALALSALVACKSKPQAPPMGLLRRPEPAGPRRKPA